jgi:hypothetical protein
MIELLVYSTVFSDVNISCDPRNSEKSDEENNPKSVSPRINFAF